MFELLGLFKLRLFSLFKLLGLFRFLYLFKVFQLFNGFGFLDRLGFLYLFGVLSLGRGALLSRLGSIRGCRAPLGSGGSGSAGACGGRLRNTCWSALPRRRRRRCLQPRHDLFDHRFETIKVQTSGSTRLNLTTADDVENLVPAPIDELVNLLSLLAAGLANSLLDLASHLGAPVFQLFPPALRISLLILHVLAEEIDLKSLDTILQDNHCVLARVQDEKDEKKTCQEYRCQQDHLHRSAHFEVALRNKQHGPSRLGDLPRKNDEDTVLGGLDDRPTGGIAGDGRPTLFHLGDQRTAEGFVRVQNYPATLGNDRLASGGDSGCAEQVCPHPRSRHVEQRSTLNHAETVLGEESIDELIVLAVELYVRPFRTLRIQRLRRIIQLVQRNVLTSGNCLARNIPRPRAVPEVFARGVHEANMRECGHFRLEPSEEVLARYNVFPALIDPENRLHRRLLENTEKSILILLVVGFNDRNPSFEEVFRLGGYPRIVEGRLYIVEEP